jgi:Domain of unknown function (DUF6930)
VSNASPSQQEWRALYAAAAEFHTLAPWEWMYDSDMFGVQNPEDGEIGYCCVMGNLGEHFALGVYRGTEGLEGYRKIQSGELEPSVDSLLHYQKCLMASFEDRSLLDRQDLGVIKQLGLKFRGRNVWPQFRSYLPDYHPWFVTAAEARFLIAALQQSLDVARRFQDAPELLALRKGSYLVRVPERDGATLRWSDQWLPPVPLAREQPAAPQIDELRVQRIKRSITARQGTWEADFFLSPSPIQEHKDERPYYAYMFLWVDRRTGMVLPPQLVAPDRCAAEFQNHFLTLIEQGRFIPQEVCVLKQEAVELLEPIAQRLGIKLRRSRRLGALEEARNSFMGFMDQM